MTHEYGSVSRPGLAVANPTGQSDVGDTSRHRTSAHFAPRQGWRAASDERRALAVLTPIVVGAMIFPGGGPGDSGDAAVNIAAIVLQVLLVPMLQTLARVVRPYRSARPPREAVVRHWLAATAVAFGAVPALMFTVEAPLIGFVSAFLAVIALPLALVTLVWGVLATGSRGEAVQVGNGPSPAPFAPGLPSV